MGRQIVTLSASTNIFLKSWNSGNARMEELNEEKDKNRRSPEKVENRFVLVVLLLSKKKIADVIQPDFISADFFVNVFLLLLQDEAFEPA